MCLAIQLIDGFCVFALFCPPTVNIVNIGGDHEISHSVRLCVYLSFRVSVIPCVCSLLVCLVEICTLTCTFYFTFFVGKLSVCMYLMYIYMCIGVCLLLNR